MQGEVYRSRRSDGEGGSRRSRSTRHIRVDENFLRLLEEDFGIDAYSLNAAFMGVPPAPKKQAIKVCEWAVKRAEGDVEYAGELVRAWARRRGVGVYHPAIVGGPPPTFGGREPEGV